VASVMGMVEERKIVVVVVIIVEAKAKSTMWSVTNNQSYPGICSETHSVVEHDRDSHLPARRVVDLGSFLERRGSEFRGIPDHSLGRHNGHHGDSIDVSAVCSEEPENTEHYTP